MNGVADAVIIDSDQESILGVDGDRAQSDGEVIGAKRKRAAKEDRGPRGKHWCFTLNNPTEAEKAALGEVSWLVGAQAVWLAFSCERGKERKV